MPPLIESSGVPATPVQTNAPVPTDLLLDTPAPTTREKRPLTSPDEQQEQNRRRINARRPGKSDAPPIGGILNAAPSATTAPPSTPGISGQELSSAGYVELADIAGSATTGIMDTVRSKTSKLNKDEIAVIGQHVANAGALITSLISRLAAAEQRAMVAEERARNNTPGYNNGSQPTQEATLPRRDFATALRCGRQVAPIPIPAPTGPTLAFAPAEEGSLKTAEETKTELKRAINPSIIGAQVTNVRKIGGARVVVQTTNVQAANRLKEAAPATLKVTELSRRQPLVCLSPIDGDPKFDEIISAVHDQNFRDNPKWTKEALGKAMRGAFKKTRRGGAAVAAVFECSPGLRQDLVERGKLYIGWQVVEATDFVSVTCCNRCQQYGHPERHCRTTEPTCSKCGATGHREPDCTSETSRCATCHKFGRGEASSHRTAAPSCPARKYAENRTMSMTNYG